MAKKVTNIQVKDTLIRTMQQNGIDYVCITDIARQKNAEEPKDVVKNWMRLKNTIEYIGLWEKLNNPQFKGVGFDPLLQEARRQNVRPLQALEDWDLIHENDRELFRD